MQIWFWLRHVPPDLAARMAAGLADDLATALLLASNVPVMIAPAMNVRMWDTFGNKA